MSGSIPASLGDIKGIESIRLGSNELLGHILSHLGESQKKLKEFDVSFNRLSGAIPQGLSKFSADSFYQPDTTPCGKP